MTWALRLGVTRSDAGLLALGALAMALTLAASTYVGDVLSLALLVALALFGLVVVAFVAVPHIALAATIPLFALLPAAKVLVVPWIGPLKDLVAVAAIAAAALTVVQAARGGQRIPGDFWIVALFMFLFALYLLNMGGGLERDWAWAHGVRLVCEPILLLLVGLTLKDPRRTLRWAMAALVATATGVALVGLAQQLVGPNWLVGFGYEWNLHVRTIEGRLRSFGTLDEPFAYAAFLLFGLCAVLMWMRPGKLAYAAGTIISAGLLLSFVRSAFVIAVGIFALWLARHGRTVTAMFLLALVLVATLTFVVSSEATERRVVQGGPSQFLTLNGRTEAWRVVFDEPGEIPLGKGVGEVGTAADRATFKVTRTREQAERGSKTVVVDSGYFAAVADIGVVGLAALLLLLGRVALLAKRGIDAGRREGWLAATLVMTLALDAVTRESFTGFPTAFLGFLFIGLALAAAREPEAAASGERAEKPRSARRRPSRLGPVLP